MALPNADFGAVFPCISFAHDNSASKTGLLLQPLFISLLRCQLCKRLLQLEKSGAIALPRIQSAAIDTRPAPVACTAG